MCAGVKPRAGLEPGCCCARERICSDEVRKGARRLHGRLRMADPHAESALAARQIVHFDLKSENVLLQDRNHRVAKVADLGMSKYVVEGCSLATASPGGARPFMPLRLSMHAGNVWRRQMLHLNRAVPFACEGGRSKSVHGCCACAGPVCMQGRAGTWRLSWCAQRENGAWRIRRRWTYSGALAPMHPWNPGAFGSVHVPGLTGWSRPFGRCALPKGCSSHAVHH